MVKKTNYRKKIRKIINKIVNNLLLNYKPRITPEKFTNVIFDRLCTNLTYSEISIRNKISLGSAHNYVTKFLEEGTQINLLHEHHGEELYIDSTCNSILRQKDKKYYCGHHKNYHVKVTVICDKNANIIYFSLAVPGSVHDIKAAGDIIKSCEFYNIRLVGDKGYFSNSFNIITPIKSRGDFKEDVGINEFIAKKRAVIEKIFAWVKNRFKISKLLRCRIRNINKSLLMTFYLEFLVERF